MALKMGSMNLHYYQLGYPAAGNLYLFAGYIDSKSTIDKVENSVDALLDGLKYGSELNFLINFLQTRMLI